jgi:hypothetical protein
MDSPADQLRQRDHWRQRNRYYYSELERLFRRHVPPRKRVLDIGSGGELLAALQPSVGIGIEDQAALRDAALQRHPHLRFVAGFSEIPAGQTFDYITLCNSVGYMHDVQATLTALRPFCEPHTRVVVAYQNAVWEPILTLASRVGLRRQVGAQNWLSRDDLENLLDLSGFQPIRHFCETLLPKHVPGVSGLLNRFFVKFWPFKHLGLNIVIVARPLVPPFSRSAPRVSVIVPTRNERGNIEAAVQRTPEMGSGTELIFVDGWSTDGTPDEIRRCMAAYPQRRMRFIAQEGERGKGQAVRQGFAAAGGDVLMILDADLTVTPEDLPKFLAALTEGKGEFINGTRLVYPMHDEAMRFLNKAGNRFFSLLFTWLLGQRFRDTLCGTKVLTRANYDKIAATRAELSLLDPFGDFDLIFGAARNDLKIIEVPVRYGARSYGQTNISRFRDGWLLLKMSWQAFLKIKLR